MLNNTKSGCDHSFIRKRWNSIAAIPVYQQVFFLTFMFFSVNAFGQAANLDQIRNGSLGVYPVTPTADWVNGNAGPSNAHFAEGYSIPYRTKVDGLVGTPATVHHLIIEWDTKHGNGHALDYITHYQNLNNPVGSHAATFGHGPEVVDPTLGTAFAGAPTLFTIPAPSSAGSEVAGQPTTSYNNLPTAAYTNNANINKMAVWGGTIISLTYVFQDAPDGTTGQTETRLDIAFTSANGSTALFAWGGHIAAEYDWGVGRGATGVSGSPYHTRIIEIDGKPGNQDRSLKATAVIIPPPLCGISAAQLACPETASLTFTAQGSSTGSNVSYSWTLTNGSTSAGAKIDGSSTGFSISVVPIGADFIAGGTFNLSLTVSKTGAQSTTCTRVPAGTIQKVIVNASASPTLIDIRTAAHSTTLTATIDATSTDPNNANYTYAWSIVTAGTTGTLTNATSRIATYTAGLGDAGSTIQFKVIATQTAAPNCSDDALVSVSVNTGPICDVSPQAAVCQGTITTHNGSPSAIFTGATYTWSLEANGGGGSTTSTFASANGGASIQVNANQSYRIVLSQVYPNTALNTSCFEDVTVVPTPTVNTRYNAPSCSEKTFTVDVLNPVGGVVYSIDQPGNNLVFPTQTSTGGSAVQFTGLVNGDGYSVTVTTNVAGCTATDNCATNPSPRPALNTTKTTTTTPAVVTKTVSKIPELYKIALGSPTKVAALPNPFTDKIRFNLVSAVSGYGSLELYNMLGQKVGTVFQGHVQAGMQLNKEYNIPADQRNTLIYVFKVGDQRVTGKLIGLK
jgi:hypothetical protein